MIQIKDPISQAMISLPSGVRFHPTDEELLDYLMSKIQELPGKHSHDIIPEIDVCKHEPWDLPAKFGHVLNSKELFFFCCVKRRYPNGKRSNRTTQAGYWKATGNPRTIMRENTNAPIGIKKILVFYVGRLPNGVKTDWVSHEYHLNPECLGLGYDKDKMLPYVAWRIKNKKENMQVMGQAPTIAPEVRSSRPHAYISNASESPVNQEGDCSGFHNTPDNEVADDQEARAAQPEMSVEKFMELLPEVQPCYGNLSEYNTIPVCQPQPGEEEEPLSFDFLSDNYGD